MKNRKNKEEGKMGRPRAFAVAKHLHCGEALRRNEGCFVAVKKNGQNGHPRVRYSEALRRGKGTVHRGKIF